MKKFFKKIWRGIARAYNYLRGRTREIVPVAIKIVEGVKKVMDSPVDDIVLSIIKDAIPGTADDIMIDKVTKYVKKELPHTLVQLRVIKSIAGIDDPNEQLKAILAELKLSSDEQKNEIYHSLSALILKSLSDGKLTWSESVVISEYYYKHIHKK
jgi:hypothetical protein